MAYRRSLMLLAMVLLVAHPDGHVQAEWVGILEPAGTSTCLDGTHKLFDPCTFESYRVKSSTLDLDESLCRFVRVEGPIETIECDVMDVQASKSSRRPVATICRGSE